MRSIGTAPGNSSMRFPMPLSTGANAMSRAAAVRRSSRWERGATAYPSRRCACCGESNALDRPFAAHDAQVSGEAALGRFREDLAGRLEVSDAIGPETAEIAAQPTPGAERPHAAPKRQTQGFDLAVARDLALVSVSHTQHAMPDHRLVQAVDDARRLEAAVDRRREDARAIRACAQLGRQHGFDLEQRRRGVACQAFAAERAHEARADD